jgi:hypothetical protein
MDNEEKIMGALYKRGKRISEGIVYEAITYDLHDILKETQLIEDEAIPSLKTLVTKHYIEWDRRAIKITAIGLLYCQSAFELGKGKMGFLK